MMMAFKRSVHQLFYFTLIPIMVVRIFSLTNVLDQYAFDKIEGHLVELHVEAFEKHLEALFPGNNIINRFSGQMGPNNFC